MLRQLHNYALTRTYHHLRFLRTQKSALLRAPKRTVYTYWPELFAVLNAINSTRRQAVRIDNVVLREDDSTVLVCSGVWTRLQTGRMSLSLASLYVSGAQTGIFQ
jgi:hypothetical protein